MFATSWQPEFCHSQSFPGCKEPNSYWSETLTMHGLWPQYTNGTWPSDCTSEHFDEAATDAVGMDTMNKVWPNVKQDPSDKDYDQFWTHEWTKHGTCSGISQKDYFQYAVDHFVEAPAMLKEAVGKTVDRDALIKAYGTVVAPICQGGKWLSEVLICKDKKTLENVDCVASVVKEGNCGASISVRAFE